MTFIEKVTGSDISKKCQEFEQRVALLPDDYHIAWDKINDHVSIYADFTGRNIIVILDQVLEMMEEMNGLGKSTNDIFAGNIDAFCQDLTWDMRPHSVREKWRTNLNKNIEKRFK